MTVLVIDTSSRRRCAAVLCDREGSIAASRVAAGPRPASLLAGQLAELLSGGAAGRLEAVVVAVGPGSYTGVRAGMAAALGVAQARGLPLHGMGSLEVAAHGAPAAVVRGRVVSDAGRGAVYAAGFIRAGEGLEVEPPALVAAVEAAELEGPLLSLESPPPAAGVIVIDDPAAAMAAAAAIALARPALDVAMLRAHHAGDRSR